MDRVLGSVCLPSFVRTRASAAAAAGSERLANSLETLATECRWNFLQSRDRAVASVYPIAVILSTALLLLLYLGVFGAISRIQGAMIPW